MDTLFSDKKNRHQVPNVYHPYASGTPTLGRQGRHHETPKVDKNGQNVMDKYMVSASLDSLRLARHGTDYLGYGQSSHSSSGSSWVLWRDDVSSRAYIHPRGKRFNKGTCGILLAVSVFFVVVAVLAIAGVAIYLGVLRNDSSKMNMVFEGSFRVTSGDNFVPGLVNESSAIYKEKAEKYKNMIETLFQKSKLKAAFKHSEIERFESGSLVVFFRLHLDRRKVPRTMTNLEESAKEIIMDEVMLLHPTVFKNIEVDIDKIFIKRIIDEPLKSASYQGEKGKKIQSNNNVNRKTNATVKIKNRNGVLLKAASTTSTTENMRETTKSTSAPNKNLLPKDEELPVIQGTYTVTSSGLNNKNNTESDKVRKTSQGTKRPSTTSTTITTTRTRTSTTTSTSTTKPTTQTTQPPIKTIMHAVPPHLISNEPWRPVIPPHHQHHPGAIHNHKLGPDPDLNESVGIPEVVVVNTSEMLEDNKKNQYDTVLSTTGKEKANKTIAPQEKISSISIQIFEDGAGNEESEIQTNGGIIVRRRNHTDSLKSPSTTTIDMSAVTTNKSTNLTDMTDDRISSLMSALLPEVSTYGIDRMDTYTEEYEDDDYDHEDDEDEDAVVLRVHGNDESDNKNNIRNEIPKESEVGSVPHPSNMDHHGNLASSTEASMNVSDKKADIVIEDPVLPSKDVDVAHYGSSEDLYSYEEIDSLHSHEDQKQNGGEGEVKNHDSPIEESQEAGSNLQQPSLEPEHETTKNKEDTKAGLSHIKPQQENDTTQLPTQVNLKDSEIPQKDESSTTESTIHVITALSTKKQDTGVDNESIMLITVRPQVITAKPSSLSTVSDKTTRLETVSAPLEIHNPNKAVDKLEITPATLAPVKSYSAVRTSLRPKPIPASGKHNILKDILSANVGSSKLLNNTVEGVTESQPTTASDAIILNTEVITSTSIEISYGDYTDTGNNGAKDSLASVDEQHEESEESATRSSVDVLATLDPTEVPGHPTAFPIFTRIRINDKTPRPFIAGNRQPKMLVYSEKELADATRNINQSFQQNNREPKSGFHGVTWEIIKHTSPEPIAQKFKHNLYQGTTPPWYASTLKNKDESKDENIWQGSIEESKPHPSYKPQNSTPWYATTAKPKPTEEPWRRTTEKNKPDYPSTAAWYTSTLKGQSKDPHVVTKEDLWYTSTVKPKPTSGENLFSSTTAKPAYYVEHQTTTKGPWYTTSLKDKTTPPPDPWKSTTKPHSHTEAPSKVDAWYTTTLKNKPQYTPDSLLHPATAKPKPEYEYFHHEYSTTKGPWYTTSVSNKQTSDSIWYTPQPTAKPYHSYNPTVKTKTLRPIPGTTGNPFGPSYTIVKVPPPYRKTTEKPNTVLWHDITHLEVIKDTTSTTSSSTSTSTTEATRTTTSTNPPFYYEHPKPSDIALDYDLNFDELPRPINVQNSKIDELVKNGSQGYETEPNKPVESLEDFLSIKETNKPVESLEDFLSIKEDNKDVEKGGDEYHPQESFEFNDKGELVPSSKLHLEEPQHTVSSTETVLSGDLDQSKNESIFDEDYEDDGATDYSIMNPPVAAVKQTEKVMQLLEEIFENLTTGAPSTLLSAANASESESRSGTDFSREETDSPTEPVDTLNVTSTTEMNDLTIANINDRNSSFNISVRAEDNPLEDKSAKISTEMSVVVSDQKENVTRPTACPPKHFRCGDGECVSVLSRCNQLVDCKDGTDERDCTCANYLQAQFLTRKLCDSVVDCWDFSDENTCEWCSPGKYVCPHSRVCIEHEQLCDGNRDCPYGDDEKQCVTVSPSEDRASEFPYHSSGYLMVRKQGKWGKLCLQNFDNVVTKSKTSWEVSDLGRAVCKALTFSDFDKVARAIDNPAQPRATDKLYYELYYSPTTNESSPSSPRSSLAFHQTRCPKKEVVHVTCRDLECGVRPQAINQWSRIVGGGNASPGSWPWQAALYKEGEFQCGATLISDYWLISAGHCFYHALDDFWVARLGALRRGTNFPSPYEQLRPISHIILHPDYIDAGFINDISLLKMVEPVTFSDYVRPICLPKPDTIVQDGKLCTVVGWGQLFEVGRIFPDTLQEVQLPLISTAECRKRTLFLPLYRVTDNMFCAGYDRGGRDACLGDSGGPLMCQETDGHWSLYGVTSNGYGCARANRPGVYTKVSNYVKWMRSIMEGTLLSRNRTSCEGHRCPLGECLPKSQVCNGFMECSDGSDERSCW